MKGQGEDRLGCPEDQKQLRKPLNQVEASQLWSIFPKEAQSHRILENYRGPAGESSERNTWVCGWGQRPLFTESSGKRLAHTTFHAHTNPSPWAPFNTPHPHIKVSAEGPRPRGQARCVKGLWSEGLAGEEVPKARPGGELRMRRLKTYSLPGARRAPE